MWEEGNGLITKHKICEAESRCLSKNCSPEDFHTRRILRATIDINGVYLDVYNVHFNWFEDGFQNEFEKLLEWIEERKNEKFIIAGDFNVSSESNCYKALTGSKVIGKRLIDCWLIVNTDAPHEPTFVGDEQSQQSRIDYVLIPEDILCKSGYVVFKERKVSDHYGLYYELNLK
ncbi:MAG: endonuclease/exonuclease/phosphatase family protein [Fervidobacterium sp.]